MVLTIILKNSHEREKAERNELIWRDELSLLKDTSAWTIAHYSSCMLAANIEEP